MAQQDTGLGWSAKSEWLLNAAGVLGSVGGLVSDIPGDTPLNTCDAVAQDIAAVGRLVYDNYDVNWRSYVAGAVGTTFYAFYIEQDSANYSLIMVTDSFNAESYRYYEGPGNVYTYNATSSDPSYPGLYYSTYTNVYKNYAVGGIPIYATIAAGLSHYSIVSQQIYKLNSGYAVSCFATWYAPDGTTITSPVLISSNADHATLSLNGTDPATQGRATALWQGMNFTMSYITGISGEISTSAPVVDLRQFAASTPEKILKIIADESLADIVVMSAPDPYIEEGAGSEEEGGGGDDLDDDPVAEETLPIPAVVGLGFSRIYVPTQTDLYNLASYLWGGNLDLDNFLKLFATPMDSILGLSAVPLVLPGTYEPIYLGGQLLQGITMPRYTGRTAVKVDMGTVTIKERWRSYLDYDPYTELAIYVPFVGIKNIKADDVMGKTIRLMYDIDILSGACIAYIRPEGGSPLYEWSGQCAMQIPITGANWDNIFNSAIHTVASLGGALFAPASAPVLVGAVASAASQAIAAKPRIERSGAMNGVTGFLGQLRPYIIRTIPEAYIPNDQNKFIGYPSYVSVNLGSLKGYNEIASIHLENIPATGDELSELESILKGGAIF